MKKLGISLDGVMRDFHTQFDKQYRKVYIHNPSIVEMNEEFEFKAPTEQDLENTTKDIEKKSEELISLPIDTWDLLNHYHFENLKQFENDNAFKTPEDSKLLNWEGSGEALKMDLEMENRILSPQEAIDDFMFNKYPFQIFGDAEELESAGAYFNRIQAYGLQNNLFETVLLTDVQRSAVSANYFFLHKIGCRARNIKVVNETAEKWNYCDVLVDVIPEVLQNKPDDKTAIKIDRLYNQWDEADYTLKTLKELNNEMLLKKLFE